MPVVLLTIVAAFDHIVRAWRRIRPVERWPSEAAPWSSPGADDEILVIDFELFRRGQDRRIENVLESTWHGDPVRIFDYVCVSQNDPVSRIVVTERYTCALASVDAVLPPLSVTHESAATAAADAAGLDDITFELDAFNRAFEVRSADARFAYAFIDQRMMRFLLQTDPVFSFETRGRWLLVSAPEIDREDTFVVLDVLKALRDHVPRVVGDLYGPAGSG